MEIKFSKSAIKAISVMDSKTKQRIKAAIYDGYFRLRVGGWRIIFTYPGKDKLMIAKIAPRGGAYKGGF